MDLICLFLYEDDMDLQTQIILKKISDENILGITCIKIEQDGLIKNLLKNNKQGIIFDTFPIFLIRQGNITKKYSPNTYQHIINKIKSLT